LVTLVILFFLCRIHAHVDGHFERFVLLLGQSLKFLPDLFGIGKGSALIEGLVDPRPFFVFVDRDDDGCELW
jgi:hypothetical protein